MGTLHTLAAVAGEFVRRGAGPGKGVTIELTPAADAGNRARGAARYTAALVVPWLTEHKLRFVTARGYLCTYQYRDVAIWATKNLPGIASKFVVSMDDASTLPAQWTTGRIAGQARRIAAINGQALKDGAMMKAQTVKDWAESQRKADTLAAARAMSEAAALLDVLNIGAPWPDPGTVEPPTTLGNGGTGGGGTGGGGTGGGGAGGGGGTGGGGDGGIWTPDAGAPGARPAPMHTIVGVAPEQVEVAKSPEEATHILAVAMQDDAGVSFWWVDKPQGLQRLLYCTDEQAIEYVQATPDLFANIEQSARPIVEVGQGRQVQYAVIRLSDGAVIQRTNRTDDNYSIAQDLGAVAGIMAMQPDGAIMGLAANAVGAEAAARSFVGWLLPHGTKPYPVPGDYIRWVESNLQGKTETARVLTYGGRAVVGIVGEALPVRPLETVNRNDGNPVFLATHAMMTPAEIKGAPVYVCGDLVACDAPDDASAIEWAINDADMWQSPYDALRRVLVRMADGVTLGERINNEGTWDWSDTTTAGKAGRMVWAPATEYVGAILLGITRGLTTAGEQDLARTAYGASGGQKFTYLTNEMGSRVQASASVVGAQDAPIIAPV